MSCPYEGLIDERKVGQLTEKLLGLGCREVSLGDTIGVGTAGSTQKMLDAVLASIGNRPELLAVHFHDT